MAANNGSSPQQQPKKITTPDRVQRIMAKLGQAKVHVLIRTKGSKPVTIKAVLSKTVCTDGKKHFLVLSNISPAGIKALQVGTSIGVDVIGLKHRLYFESRISANKETYVAAPMPTAIIMVERRGAERHAIRSDSMCFIEVQPFKAIDKDDDIITPFFPPYSNLALRFPVADISPSGTCLKTRFEDTMKWLQLDPKGVDILLHLPRQAPVKTTARVCWQRINKAPNSEGRTISFLLVGLQFGQLEDHELVKVKRYIRDMTIKEAI